MCVECPLQMHKLIIISIIIVVVVVSIAQQHSNIESMYDDDMMCVLRV